MLGKLPTGLLPALIVCLFLFWLHLSFDHAYYPQDNKAGQQRGGPISQVIAEADNAAAARGLELFTAVLAFSTIGLWVVTWKSGALAERALIDLERPWIYVEINPRLIPMKNPDEPAEAPSTAFAQFYISNYGRGPATIFECSEVCNFGIEPDSLLYDQTRCGVIAPDKRAGPYKLRMSFSVKRADILVDLTETEAGEAIAYNPEMPDDEDLFFRITLNYHGILVKDRASAFCWRFDRREAQWAIHGGEEYNRQT